MREKTREIINENVDVGEIRDDFPTYKLGEEFLEDVEGLDNPGVKASQIAHATQDHLHPRTSQNPRYQRLSERVTEIVERWQGGDVSDPEAVEALKSIENEVLEVEDEAGDDASERAKYAIRTHLIEELDNGFEDDEKAVQVADSIVDMFEDRVDRAYPGWETNESTEQDIETLILDVVALEYDRPDLIDDPFVDAVRDYLVSNYA